MRLCGSSDILQLLFRSLLFMWLEVTDKGYGRYIISLHHTKRIRFVAAVEDSIRNDIVTELRKHINYVLLLDHDNTDLSNETTQLYFFVVTKISFDEISDIVKRIDIASIVNNHHYYYHFIGDKDFVDKQHNFEFLNEYMNRNEKSPLFVISNKTTTEYDIYVSKNFDRKKMFDIIFRLNLKYSI